MIIFKRFFFFTQDLEKSAQFVPIIFVLAALLETFENGNVKPKKR